MIRTMQTALIKKDIRSITANKRLFPVLIIVPLVMVIFLPTVFILTAAFTPEDGDGLQVIIEALPYEMQQGNITEMTISVMLNNIIPLFFLLIPIMAASVMAASSFVGEKEKRTLETLLYCPLSLRQIFNAKVLASFLLSMMVSLLSFVVMLVVVEAELWFIIGGFILPDVSWLVLLLLVSPAVSLIAIIIIVRGSAKAQTVEESQQRSIFLIMPIILLAAGQFSGLFLIGAWLMLGLGIALAAIALLLMWKSFGRFQYETLLS